MLCLSGRPRWAARSGPTQPHAAAGTPGGARACESMRWCRGGGGRPGLAGTRRARAGAAVRRATPEDAPPSYPPPASPFLPPFAGRDGSAAGVSVREQSRAEPSRAERGFVRPGPHRAGFCMPYWGNEIDDSSGRRRDCDPGIRGSSRVRSSPPRGIRRMLVRAVWGRLRGTLALLCSLI